MLQFITYVFNACVRVCVCREGKAFFKEIRQPIYMWKIITQGRRF